MRLIYAGIALACATLGFADTITLKSGRVINGTYLGGTARTVRVDDGVNVRTLDVSDIARIEFGGSSAESSTRYPDRSSNGPTLRRAEFEFEYRLRFGPPGFAPSGKCDAARRRRSSASARPWLAARFPPAPIW